MKLEQLISAGFAITALAAASVPAVGYTLLGAPPVPSSPFMADTVPITMARASLPAQTQSISVTRTISDSSDRFPVRRTPW
jgi:hypothetical protein